MRLTVSTVLGLLVSLLAPAAGASAGPLPQANHVFIIVLENENAETTFGPAGPPYLRDKLTAKGVFVPNYYAIGHYSLDNYIAMVSGQAPNPQTQIDCLFYTDFLPGTPTAGGQFIGSGCVYPPSVETIADQLEANGFAWKGYMEDMAASVPAEPGTCRHPVIGEQDHTQSAEAEDQYASRHNPFMYFHSIIDEQESCDANVVDYSEMKGDLKKIETTANYNFITPDLCSDGHDEPCIDGRPGGLESANDFLREAVPTIMRSPAYGRHGMIIINFDEAEADGGDADASACCNEQPGPNTPNPGGPTVGPGGGRVGAVMLSPCIRKGTTSEQAYNHYSLLRSIENNFGLPHLGFAGQQGLEPFGRDILSRRDCHERIHLGARPKAPRRGVETTFNFRVRSPYRRCSEGVNIDFAGEQAKTDRHGRASIRTSLSGPETAEASKRNCRGDGRVLEPR